ncbi:hypothetical protein [Flavobacterium sp.]|uniref:hypothetical protein n=1 Tax=Flavobacterium sp. TaxID=239 RepID=UPI003753E0AE
MKKKHLLLIILILNISYATAQVGINTPSPDAQLDIKSSSQVAPVGTDGILIPKVNVFSAINPTISQQGMLVYLTTATTFGGNPKPIGFYYWNFPTLDWIGISTTANGDHDWYEVGTTTAPDAITDNMFHTGNVGINTPSPATIFDVKGNNNWNTSTGEGDVRIGDPTYRFKIGIANSGAGAGDIRLTADGGTNRIFLGNATNSTLTTIDGLNNRVGIKNVLLPNSVLDINGDLALREGTAIAVTAGANAITPTGEFSHYRLTSAAGAFSINTIANGNDGQLVTLINVSGQVMTVNNNNAANGILTGTGANLVSSSGLNSNVTFIYNASLSRWIVKSQSGMINSNSWNITGNAGLNGGNITTAGTNYIGTTDNQNIDFRTNNLVRGRFSNLGEFFVGTLNTVLTGDLCNAVGNVTFPWALNGYSDFNGSGTYGQITSGTTIFGGVQGEYNGTNAQGTGVRGIALTATGGTAFTAPHTGVSGQATTSGSYKFGTYGSGGASSRSGGILGNDFGVAMGALGYFSSGLLDYAVYGFGLAHANGTAGGRISTNFSEKNTNIGLGIYGGVMGGWVRGMKYGFHTKGETYSLYVDGNGYTNKPLAYLITTDGNKKIASFMSTSMQPEVTVNGKSNLENGKVFVPFNKSFQQIIANIDDVIITASPQGKSNGVYIDTISKEGFWIYENNDGTSNVKISWIAITKIKGEENPEISEDLLAKDFDTKMDRVMFNENDTINTAQSLWWDGTKIRWDRPTSEKADTETKKLSRPNDESKD